MSKHGTALSMAELERELRNNSVSSDIAPQLAQLFDLACERPQEAACGLRALLNAGGDTCSRQLPTGAVYHLTRLRCQNYSIPYDDGLLKRYCGDRGDMVA